MIKQFNEFVNEGLTVNTQEHGNKKVNIFIGRFQPFTLGHAKVLESLYKKNKLTTVVFLIRSKKTKKDDNFKRPFDIDLQKDMLKAVKSRYNIEDIIVLDSAAIDKIFNSLRPKYEPVLWGAGSDRIKSYSYQVDKQQYRDELNVLPDFKLHEIKRTGKNISATQVRIAILKDDFEEFSKLVPKELHKHYDKLKTILNLKNPVHNFNESNTNKKEDMYIIKTFEEFIQYKKINEGGNIFKGKTDRIPKEYIKPTLKEYYKELNKLFPKKKLTFTKFVPVGSAGKKDFSGDIDLAIDISSFFPDSKVEISDLKDWNINEKDFINQFEKFKKRSRTATDEQLMLRTFLTLIGEYINNKSDILYINIKKTRPGNMFGLFPQYNEKGERQDIGVQIDWMVGNLDWLTFSYFSDAPIENVKGLHRTQLMLSLFDLKGYSFNHVSGVKHKESGEVVATTSQEAIKLLSNIYNKKLNKKILQNYVNLHKWVKSSLNDKEYQNLLDIYFKILDRTRADIPYDMQENWIKSQARLGLTGKFLPNNSNLIKYKK